MPWGRIDSDFWRHRKVDQVSHASVGAFWLAVSWSNDKGTDGVITPATIRQLGITPEETEELVSACLWDREGDALRIHDFLNFNKSAAQVAEEKARHTELGAKGLAARYGGTPSATLDPTPLPVSRIPYPVIPLSADPPRASDEVTGDPANVYWNLTGKYPSGKAVAWIDSLIEQYGAEPATKAMAQAFLADRTGNTLLGRTRDILASEARRLDIKEREAERERLREKRARPRELDPMEQAFRDALLKRYGEQGQVA